MKRCNKCMEYKELEEFSKNRSLKSGYSYQCKECAYDNTRNWRKNNISKRRKYANDYYRTNKGKAVKMKVEACSRAKRNNLSFTLETEFIEEMLLNNKCSKSNLLFENNMEHNGIRNPFGASIDRINNSKGYTNDNVQLVCNMYNMGKNEFDEIDFIAMCIGVAENNKNNIEAQERYKLLSGKI